MLAADAANTVFFLIVKSEKCPSSRNVFLPIVRSIIVKSCSLAWNIWSSYEKVLTLMIFFNRMTFEKDARKKQRHFANH